MWCCDCQGYLLPGCGAVIVRGICCLDVVHGAVIVRGICCLDLVHVVKTA